jgi:hypothetical protein
MKHLANKHRRPHPAYRVGDEVFLSLKGLKGLKVNKLDSRKSGPYNISQVVSPYSYRLALPSSMKIHDVFHASLLTPLATAEPMPGQQNSAPLPVTIQEQDEYVVEQVINSMWSGRGKTKTFYYKIH